MKGEQADPACHRDDPVEDHNGHENKQSKSEVVQEGIPYHFAHSLKGQIPLLSRDTRIEIDQIDYPLASTLGPKRTCACALQLSAIGGKTDIGSCSANVCFRAFARGKNIDRYARLCVCGEFP